MYRKMLSDRSGVVIRFPSTANLLISSLDRVNPTTTTSADFTISLKQNILTGFFTRFAIVEVVLDFCLENVSTALKNTKFAIKLSNSSSVTTVTIEDGSYTVQALLDAIVVALNGGGDPDWSVSGIPGKAYLRYDDPANPDVNFVVVQTALSKQLGMKTATGNAYEVLCQCPNLVPYEYLDFVCPQITYQQDLKDATTAASSRDVLYRWNFAWDTPSPEDGYGYPIYQGYQRFIARRYLPFPKQIKWDTAQPIGQLSFQIYDPNGKIVQVPIGGDTYKELEWSMTLLASEQ